MERRRIQPRPDWARTVESHGLSYHTADGRPYWDEGACYQFVRRQIDQLEEATYALNELCLRAVEVLLTERAAELVSRFLIPEPFVELCRRSWDRDEVSIYGRFDLAYDGANPPTMIEYNADTPTSLLEAGVVQWFWLKDTHPQAGPHRRHDQFNSIHERLIEAWRRWRADGGAGDEVHFAGITTSDEDLVTAAYLRDTAMQAGLTTTQLDIARVGWNHPLRQFVDERERPIRACFKLYPWEWMIREPFARHLLESAGTTRWLEPPWKMILANKAILPVLWELFPGHENLLPAAYARLGVACVRKPLFGREGKGVAIIPAGAAEPPVTAGPYDGPPVYQAYRPLPDFGGNHPVVGSWMVDGHACGIGIREDAGPITGNASRFVPHVFTM